LEGRYVLVSESDNDNLDRGYTNVLLSLRFRIPFIKREF
jgi:hypothetical protein